jgi:predicted nucleic acid-binding protein
MNVLVDTCVWSLALRRRRSGLSEQERLLSLELTDLIRDNRILMTGPVRQELLASVRTEPEFQRLRERLAAFPDETPLSVDYDDAAHCHLVCRKGGVAGSPVDFLLCAISIRCGASILTTDQDFERYAQHLPVKLHRISGR